jgi:hypothetical protein
MEMRMEVKLTKNLTTSSEWMSECHHDQILLSFKKSGLLVTRINFIILITFNVFDNTGSRTSILKR